MVRNRFFFRLFLMLILFHRSVASEPLTATYGLRPGLELVGTATLELVVQGSYSEQSTRIIESRLVVLDQETSGQWPVLGLSRITHRVLEGQELNEPFQHDQAYRFRMSAQGEFLGYEGDKAELGTGWTPMIHIPPLPKETLTPEMRSEVALPIDMGLQSPNRGKYSILVRSPEANRGEYLIGASLLQSLILQPEPLVTVLYQEHEIRFDPRTRLSPFSRTSTQMQMETPKGAVPIDLTLENHLQQANVFPAEYLPSIRAEVDNFFRYKDGLLSGNERAAAENLKFLSSYAENSPVRFMREAAKDLIDKYQYEKSFEENRKRSDLASQAPAFSGNSIQGEPILFPPEKRKAVVLLFWALWWEPSERALWDMEEIRKTLSPRNLQFVGINLDSMEKISKNYIAQSGIQMPILWDQGYPKFGVAFHYGVHTIPAIVVIDKNGKIVGRDLPPDQLPEVLLKVSR